MALFEDPDGSGIPGKGVMYGEVMVLKDTFDKEGLMSGLPIVCALSRGFGTGFRMVGTDAVIVLVCSALVYSSCKLLVWSSHGDDPLKVKS